MNTITNESLGTAIAVQLTRRGRTRAWLAERAGMSAATLGRKINGGPAFDIDECSRIAAAFDMSLVSLLTLADQESGQVA